MHAVCPIAFSPAVRQPSHAADVALLSSLSDFSLAQAPLEPSDRPSVGAPRLKKRPSYCLAASMGVVGRGLFARRLSGSLVGCPAQALFGCGAWTCVFVSSLALELRLILGTEAIRGVMRRLGRPKLAKAG